MKRMLLFVVFIVLAGRLASAQWGPYSSLSGEIVRIDPRYQATVPIGNGSQNVEAIEYSRDGFLYGVNSAADSLVRVDPSTGVAETIGPLGIDLDWIADLDEDGQGQLWLLQGDTGRLYQVDRVSGAASLQCQANSSSLGGLVILDGTFYTTTYEPDPPDPGCGLEYIDGYAPYLEKGPGGWIHELSYWYLPQHVFCVFSRIDPTTGSYEELGQFVYMWDTLEGLTFDPSDQLPPAIPALDWGGCAVFILLLSIAGFCISSAMKLEIKN